MVPKEYICIYPREDMMNDALSKYQEEKKVVSWSVKSCPPINPKVIPDPSYELRIIYFDD